MKVNFDKIILHNFISFAHNEIDLKNRDYCLVSGINNCPLDNTVSNGSGKSSIWSAITFALTGETISGLKDVKNKFIDEKSCYVTLFFNVDGTDYEVTRIKEPKSDLKLFINGEDKSGKGIKDTSITLAQCLPDLTFDLISSVILIGQGMPNKLSGRTPSGRKELLEKLSKSDFMIEDVKKRITERSNYLYAKQRTLEDSTLSNNTQLNSINSQIKKITDKLNSLILPNVNEYENKQEYYNTLIETVEDRKNKVVEIETSLNELTINYNNLNNNKQQEINDKYVIHNNVLTELRVKQSECYANYNSTKKEFDRLSSITDVCPTCGQKLIGVEKPDTTEIKNKLDELYNSGFVIQDEMKKENDSYNELIKEINDRYTEDINNQLNVINDVKNELNKLKSSINVDERTCRDLQVEIVNLKNSIDNYEINKTNYENELNELNNNKVEINNLLTSLEEQKNVVRDHLDIIKKFDTLVKRDFRGYLLQNIIHYIDSKAKEYCPIVFGSNQIEFILDGNDINISYCGKEYEGLSGGEKQKVDLIIQFALRDLMSKYLGFSSNILILDEIFDNLDAQGTNNVINLISNHLTDIESIFIISHHSDELQLNYDTEITVIKNREGISEVR